MATTIEVGDIIEVRHEFTDGETRAFNVLEYQVQAVTDTATGLPAAVAIPLEPMAPTIANVAYNAWAAPWALLASVDASFENTTIQGVHPAPRSRPFTYIPEDRQEGTRPGELLPLQDSVTFLKRSGYGMRWGMGRFFLVGLSETDQQAGRMVPAWMMVAVAQANNFKASLLAVGDTYTVQLQPVLFRGADAPLPQVVPITSIEVSNNILKTQTRRRPGKGI